jgi:hypothetical protein
MATKFRALRLIALFYKIMAWLVLIGGAVMALVMVILGAIQGREGVRSPLLANLPMSELTVGVAAGIAMGLFALLVSLISFVLFYAVNDVIQLGLAIERNTRETALFLSGENTVPPPPMPGVEAELPLTGRNS